MPEHSFRDSVDEEFDAVIEGRLESSDRALEQRYHYAELYPEALAERPLWNAVIARKNISTVALFARIWFDHVLRYARRDQLSATIAAKISRVSLNRVPIDNGDSEIHSWPIQNKRNNHIRNAFWPDSNEVKIRLADAESTVERLKAESHRVNLALAEAQSNIENLNLEILGLNAQLQAVWSSLSWKLTRPLQFLMRLVRGMNKR